MCRKKIESVNDLIPISRICSKLKLSNFSGENKSSPSDSSSTSTSSPPTSSSSSGKFICSRCDKLIPATNARYRCRVCYNYNLCGACYGKGHDPSHPIEMYPQSDILRDFYLALDILSPKFLPHPEPRNAAVSPSNALEVRFHQNRSMVLDTLLLGITKMTVSVTKFGRIFEAPFSVGAVPISGIDRVMGGNPAFNRRFDTGYGDQGACRAGVYAHRADGRARILSYSGMGELVLPNEPKIKHDDVVLYAVELDNNSHTMHFFKDGKMVSGGIRHVPVGCRLMFGGWFEVRVVSLHRLAAPTVSADGGEHVQMIEWMDVL